MRTGRLSKGRIRRRRASRGHLPSLDWRLRTRSTSGIRPDIILIHHPAHHTYKRARKKKGLGCQARSYAGQENRRCKESGGTTFILISVHQRRDMQGCHGGEIPAGVKAGTFLIFCKKKKKQEKTHMDGGVEGQKRRKGDGRVWYRGQSGQVGKTTSVGAELRPLKPLGEKATSGGCISTTVRIRYPRAVARMLCT